MPPTVVAFDVMDTVVRDPFREALEAASGRPVAEVLRHRDPGSWPRFERGELTEEQFWATFHGLELDVEAFHRVRRDGYAWLPGMAQLLDDLAGVVRRVGASNYPVWLDELCDGMLAGRFEDVVGSHELGVRKPAPAFYARLCARIGVHPREVIFVDDREENVEGALEAGLGAHLFADADDVRERLRREGLPL